jgi:signal recognition particle subunit SRP54
MFESLSEKLQRAFKNLRGEGRLTEEHIDNALKEIRIALLEADVNFKVVKQFTDAVRAKAVGQDVLQSLSPAQQVIKIVRDELVDMLGGENARFALRLSLRPSSCCWLAGCRQNHIGGKLSKWLSKNDHRPMLVSVDVYRPAAREQLKVIARDIGVKIWEGEAGDKPLALCQNALREARNTGTMF